MTYESLKALSPVVAAGVAARAAQSLHSTRDLSDKNDISNEAEYRSSIIAEIRNALGLGQSTEQQTLETIVHELYEYSDSLLERVEEMISGLFTVNPSVSTNAILTRRIRRENKIISKTVAYPSKQYREFIGQKGGNLQFECIYVREVQAMNTFFEIVVARQSGRAVNVSQVLRFYPNNNAKTVLPDGQINLLLKTLGTKVTAEAIASVLQAWMPQSTSIIIYASHWVFSYYTGGTTDVLRDLGVILGDGFLNGFTQLQVGNTSTTTN
jgi:hypothetical protein